MPWVPQVDEIAVTDVVGLPVHVDEVNHDEMKTEELEHDVIW